MAAEQELEVARRGQSELGKDRARGDRFAFKEAQNYSGNRVRAADTQSIQNSDSRSVWRGMETPEPERMRELEKRFEKDHLGLIFFLCERQTY